MTGHPKTFIGVWVVVLLASVLFAQKLPNELTAGGFNNPNSESAMAQTVLQSKFSNQYPQNMIIVLKDKNYTVSQQPFQTEVNAVATALRSNAYVANVKTYYQNHNANLVGKDKHTTIIDVGLNATETQADNLMPAFQHIVKTQVKGGFNWWVTGSPALNYDLNATTKHDLTSAEMIAFPLMIVILLLVFRSVIAAILPLAMAMVALPTTMAIAYGFASHEQLNTLLTNAISMVGLGVIVDYALFIVSRYRKELAQGREVRDAVRKAVETAGRSVFFSGMTVAISLSSLFLPRIMIFNSIAIGGVIVVVLAVSVALTLLPAILTLLGHRVNALRLPFGRKGSSGRWERFVHALMKKPVLFLVPAVLILMGLAYPSSSLRMQVPVASASILPKTSMSRQGLEVVKNQFGEQNIFPIQVVLTSNNGTMTSTNRLQTIHTITKKIASLSNTKSVHSLTNWHPGWTIAQYHQAYLHWSVLPSQVQNQLGNLVNHNKGSTTSVLIVGSKAPADSVTTHQLVQQIRILLDQSNLRSIHAYVGGQTATGLDFDQKVLHSFPIIIVSVLIISFLVLLWSFRSIILPIKALVLNSLVTLASTGLLVEVFQRGIFGKIDTFNAINSVTPVVLFAVLFGLSMDYEVFIISRIREFHDRGVTNEQSIARGIADTAGLVNGAAAIMVAVFAAFATVQVEVVKELGFSLACAILLDALIVRTILVPSIMKLLGRANWWGSFHWKPVESEIEPQELG
ncbi:MMPL family transporter [Alicyclobacillus sp. SO9]|nr:MMPL family transporter [Alicyclobacillus sp. SO9]